jgi:hypothetical protein
MGFCTVHNWREMVDCPGCTEARQRAFPETPDAGMGTPLLTPEKAEEIRRLNAGHRDLPAWENAIQAQIDGEPLGEDTTVVPMLGQVAVSRAGLEDMHRSCSEIVAAMADALGITEEAPVEANFGFYVDGYTMRSTPNIGEVTIIGPDGRMGIVKSSVITQFLERRLPEDGNQSSI